MLCSLRIKNLALVEDLALDFGGGFTVLTGETGTGKSLLVDALALLLGARADTDVVRAGADRASVEAVVGGDYAAWASLLHDKGLPPEQPVALRREVGAGGRSRAWINGGAATLTDLREASRIWVRLTSQHDHQSLLSEERHLGLFDELIGLEADLGGEVYALRDAKALLDARRKSEAGREGRLGEIEEHLAALGKLSPKPNEWSRLQAERGPLRHATRLEGAWAEASEALRAAMPLLETAGRAISRAAAVMAEAQADGDRMRSCLIDMEDLSARAVEEHRRWAAGAAGRLEEVEARLAKMEGLARRLRCGPDELSETRLLLEKERDALLGGGESMAALENALSLAAGAYLAAAERLHAERLTYVPALERGVRGKLSRLGMAGAKLQIRVGFCEDASSPAAHLGRGARLSPKGFTELSFWIEPNVGEGLRPLAKTASGGELSRLMLALLCAGKGAGGGQTLIFDEIDAGLGGEAALAVGASIAGLAAGRQVLAVTHLAQVAARADHHGVLQKETAQGRTRTVLEWVDGEDRVRELARQLSGQPDGPEAQAHARSLLA